MSSEMMNTKEVAQYLGIHEKQVYALIKAKRIPSTRLTGKWIFPKNLIDDWIISNAKTGIGQARQKSRKISGSLLASGSNDPVLDVLLTCTRHYHPELYIFTANTGSSEGLKALNLRYTDIAWSHLFDPQTNEYNIPFLATYLPNIKPVVANLFHRELGLLASRKNPLSLKGIKDIARKGIRFINRQKGSGTRVLLDYHLKKLGITGSKVSGYEKEVYTHLEVGLSILSGEADVGIATIAVAHLLGLHFIPITQESFDMVLDQSTFFEKSVQSFIGVIHSKEFQTRIAKMGGYDFKDAGKILFSQQ